MKVLEVATKFQKNSVVDVRTGDVIRVSQRIKEGAKERVQDFEGLVIRVRNKNGIANSILVRKQASGVWVEKGFMLHAPSVEKVEVLRRQKTSRNYLTYMRGLTGKKARLQVANKFDKDAVNTIEDQIAEDLGVAEEATEQDASTPVKEDSESKKTPEAK